MACCDFSEFCANVRSLIVFIGNFIYGMIISVFYIIKAIILFFIPKCLRFKDVSNDIVLITGGASGIGRLLAIKFAKLGSKVIIWDLNQSGLEETAKMIEELRSKKENVGKCHYYTVDISKRENVYAAAERIKQEIGTVTIVVNNAGIVTGKRFLECSDEKIIKTFDVNILAHFWVSCVVNIILLIDLSLCYHFSFKSFFETSVDNLFFPSLKILISLLIKG